MPVSVGAFTAQHQSFWDASRRVNGDAVGTRELIDVLLLHRHMYAEQVLAGLRAAAKVGSVVARGRRPLRPAAASNSSLASRATGTPRANRQRRRTSCR
jgi:hypothetical protein